MKELDLNYKLKGKNILNKKDEIGSMAKVAESFKEELKNVLVTIQGLSKKVLDNSKKVNNSSKEAVESFNSVNTTIEEIAKGAGELAGSSQNGAERLGNLSDKIRIVVDNNKSLKENS